MQTAAHFLPFHLALSWLAEESLAAAGVQWAGTYQLIFLSNTSYFRQRAQRAALPAASAVESWGDGNAASDLFGPSIPPSLVVTRTILLKTVYSGGNMITESSRLEKKISWGYLISSGHLNSGVRSIRTNPQVSHKLRIQSVFSLSEVDDSVASLCAVVVYAWRYTHICVTLQLRWVSLLLCCLL